MNFMDLEYLALKQMAPNQTHINLISQSNVNRALFNVANPKKTIF